MFITAIQPVMFTVWIVHVTIFYFVYCPGTLRKAEQDGCNGSRNVCRPGKICNVAIDEANRDGYLMAFRRPDILG